MTAITGVSGSGKTSLLHGVIGASAEAGHAVGCREIEGLASFHSVIQDANARQRRTRSSCVATLLPVYHELKKQLAATEQARAAGFRAAHFAFLGKSGGACRACSGLGWVRSEFDFLGADSWLLCEQCGGRRFDDDTLAVLWRGLSIADILDSTIEEMCAQAEDAKIDGLVRPLRVAVDLGLGYLKLGQSADSLSGGEVQRLMLAVHLATPSQGATLFLLDEPTRGLHPDDVVALLAALERLLDAGHTIVTVEHDRALIGAADHVVDLGPGAGSAGGEVMFAGTPAELAQLDSSDTALAIRT
jgi:excinuclease ABC subunit A